MQFENTKRELKAGDIIKIEDKRLITGGNDLLDDKIYKIFMIDNEPHVIDEVKDELMIYPAVDSHGYAVAIQKSNLTFAQELAYAKEILEAMSNANMHDLNNAKQVDDIIVEEIEEVHE